MNCAADKSVAERVLVLTPSGNDAAVVGDVLKTAGVHTAACEDIVALSDAFQEGAGVLLVSEEGLDPARVFTLSSTLAGQPPWSDISLLIVTRASETDEKGQHLLRLFAPHGNVTLLERPLRPISLISAVQAALRARRRQYQLCQFVQEKERSLQLAREAERRFRAIFNQQFQFMSILSPDGTVTEINDLPFRSTNISRDDVVGHLFWETPFWAHLPEMQAEWPARLARAAKSDGPVITVDPKMS